MYNICVIKKQFMIFFDKSFMITENKPNKIKRQIQYFIT